MENQAVLEESSEDVLTDHVAGLRQLEQEGYESGVRKGRNALYWIAGLMIVADVLIAYSRNELNLPLISLIAIVAAVFAGLALLSHIKPYLALVLGMILYVTLCGTDIIYNLKSGNLGSVAILTGFIVRIVFIVFLFRALPDARKLERMKKESA